MLSYGAQRAQLFSKAILYKQQVLSHTVIGPPPAVFHRTALLSKTRSVAQFSPQMAQSLLKSL